MAIDRVTSSSAALTIPERYARERPGQSQPAPALLGPGQDSYEPVVPGAVAALLDGGNGADGADGKLATAVATALTGKLAAEALLGDAVSMQPNQLFTSRQLVWHPPEPSAMAASWMAMVRTYAEQRAALVTQSHGRHMPASLFLSEGASQVMRDGRLPPRLLSELDAWRFAVYAWGAEKLVLRVIARDPDDDEPSPPGRHRSQVALRLEIHLPDLGKVVLEMVPVEGGGALLEIGAAQAGAMRYMRQLLPQLGEIASHFGVRVLRIRLTRELSMAGSHHPTRMQVAMLTAPMFKAMAELAVLLSQPLPAAEPVPAPKS